MPTEPPLDGNGERFRQNGERFRQNGERFSAGRHQLRGDEVSVGGRKASVSRRWGSPRARACARSQIKKLLSPSRHIPLSLCTKGFRRSWEAKAPLLELHLSFTTPEGERGRGTRKRVRNTPKIMLHPKVCLEYTKKACVKDR